MVTRMKENSIKGAIYALLFVVLMVRSFLSEVPVESARASHKPDIVFPTAPATGPR